jgi:beta-glucosidase/6-phospho-beta-glucosidase/beta-galactosidase
MSVSDRVFQSFFLAGFECSSHRRADGTRLDMLAATRHDLYASADYGQIMAHGLHTARDGIRWHLIEQEPGRYNWSSFMPMLRAASASRMQVIWDLCHYGWPDDIDIWSSSFVERFGDFAEAVAQVVRNESDQVPIYCPVNEMSFWAWAGGDVARINPAVTERGGELKRQLVRATIAAIQRIRNVDPRARFITAEPIIHVTGGLADEPERAAAEHYRLMQFEAVDLLCGRLEPELGGNPSFLDIFGVNFYPDNQWYLHGSTIPMGHHEYRPLQEMLMECWARYQRPILIAETGAERSARASWLHYVCAEVRDAIVQGVDIQGICLYPVLDYPGWDNERLCQVGLLSAADAAGNRSPCSRTAAELTAQLHRFNLVTPESRTASR